MYMHMYCLFFLVLWRLCVVLLLLLLLLLSFGRVSFCCHVLAFASTHCTYLAFSPIYGLLIKLLANVEVDFCSTDSCRGLDVELFPILADLHVGLRGSCSCHFPQHSIHTCMGTTFEFMSRLDLQTKSITSFISSVSV